MTGIWWLAEKEGRPCGPFTTDELTQMLADKRLARGELVWSAHSKKWFTARRAALPGSLPENRRLHVIGKSSILLGYVAGFLICLILLYDKSVETWDFDLTILWLLAGATLLLASAGSWIIWGRFSRLGGGRSELAAVRSIAVSLLALLGVIVGALELYSWEASTSALQRMRSYAYRIDADANGHINVRGDIGPGFAARLRAVRQAAPEAKTIDITSLGGLTDEALASAKQIEAQRMTVVVRKVCASACLLLLAAGTERLADYRAKLDFHATATLSSVNLPIVMWSARQQDALVRKYFQARGFPTEVVDTAVRLGPSRVESLNALEALDLHILTGVLSGDAPMSHAQLQTLLAGVPRRQVRSSVYDDTD